MWGNTFSYSFFVFLTAFVAVFCFSISGVHAFDCQELDEVNINSASQEKLECLDGIGPAYSERIIENRPFSSLDSLQDVSGIGPVTVENIKKQGLAVVGEEGAVEEEKENEEETDGGTEEGENEEDNEQEDKKSSNKKDISSHSSPVELSVMDGPTTVKISAGRDRLVSTESRVRFKVYIDSEENLPHNAEFKWVLGDGSVKEGKEIEHRYFASGNYSVVLTVRTRKEEAVSRVEVEVVEPEVHIKKADDNLITLYNSGQKEINLGGWKLILEDKSFELPENTIIAPKSDLNLPVQVTEIPVDEGDELELSSPEGGISDSFAKDQDGSDNDVDRKDKRSALEKENEKLHSEVSLLREEVSRAASSQRETPPEVAGMTTDNAKKANDTDVSENEGGNEENTEEASEEDTEKKEAKVIYDSSEEDEGLWRKLLGAPAAVFSRLPF